MPTYLMKAIQKIVLSGKFDPISLTMLAAAGGVALVEHISKKG